MTNKITIKDIASAAKVSKSTVSRVLNNSSNVNLKKRKAVQAAMDRLNFTPNHLARGLAGGRSMTIGVVTHDIASPFYDLIAKGIALALRETPYSPVLVDGQWNAEVEEKVIHTLLDRRVDGLIVIGGNIAKKKLEKIREERPLIVVAREIIGWTEGHFFVDNHAGAYEATKYLIDAGHREIAFISGIESHQDAGRRRSGYLHALKDAKIDVNEELIVAGDFRASSGVLAAESLLARQVNFSAIFSSNDEMAFGARLLMYRRGIRVPEDVSIIGFDDQPISAFVTPPLTTTRQPAFELGSAAAKAIVNLLAGQPVEVPVLTTKLVIRESVARR